MCSSSFAPKGSKRIQDIAREPVTFVQLRVRKVGLPPLLDLLIKQSAKKKQHQERGQATFLTLRLRKGRLYILVECSSFLEHEIFTCQGWPKRARYSGEEMNASTISAFTKLPLN